MAILIACPSCSKKFKVADDLAGRKVKCAQCGGVIPVPHPEGIIERPAAPPPLPAGTRASRPAEDEDADEDELPAPHARRGRAAEVEEPGDDTSPPPRKRKRASTDDEDEEEEAPRSRRRRRAEDDEEAEDEARARRRSRADEDDVEEDEDDDEDAAHRRRRRKQSKGGSKAILLVGVGCLALLFIIAGLGAAVWWFWPGGLPGAARYLPDKPQVIVQIRAGDILQSGAFQQVKNAMPDVQKTMDAETQGVPSNDVVTVLAGGNGADMIAVVTVKNAINAADILAKKPDKASYKEVKVGSYTMYQGPSESFCVPESKVLVVGKTETLRKALERDKKPELSDGMKAALGQVSFSKSVAMAISVKDMPKGGLAGMPMPANVDAITGGVEGVAVQADVGSDVDVNAVILCKDAKSADDMKKQADGGIVTVKNMMKNNPQGGKELIDLLDSVKMSTSGSRVKASVTIKVAPLIMLMKSGGPTGGMP